jgi:hypothetical protein
MRANQNDADTDILLTLRQARARQMFRDSRQRRLRDAHPKMHGCVAALFRVSARLPERFALGIFSPGATYEAWIRFSSQDDAIVRPRPAMPPRPDLEDSSSWLAPDTKRDARGMAIKLLRVGGPKLFGGPGSSEHDFITMSAPVLLVRGLHEFRRLFQLRQSRVLSTWRTLAYVLSHWPGPANLPRCFAVHDNPLALSYFSVTPYALGDRFVVRYRIDPLEEPSTYVRPPHERDHLRLAMREQLARGPVRFSFQAQVRRVVSPDEIDSPGFDWTRAEAATEELATIEIPQQEFDTNERRTFGQELSFNPWRCLEVHRPLGALNQARRRIYEALSALRHQEGVAKERAVAERTVPERPAWPGAAFPVRRPSIP